MSRLLELVLIMQVDELPHLQTFSTAAELSSFTAAAKAMHLTQSAISQRIQALETLIGRSLFERQGTRLVLTQTGHVLYEYAQRILALHREAHKAVVGADASTEDELQIAASSVPGEHLLPELLSGFRKKFPHIRIRAAILDSMAVIEQVSQGQSQLGLVGRMIDSPHLEFRGFATDELVIVAPPTGRRKRQRTVSFEEFRKQSLILREPGSGSRWCLEQALASCGKAIADLDVVLELGSNELIREAVLKGMGVAVMSRLTVQKDIDEGRLTKQIVSGLSLKRSMYVVRDVRRVLPNSARLFCQFIS